MVVAGLMSGPLGIGAGALKVTATDHYMRLPLKVSSATRNFMIGVTAGLRLSATRPPGYYVSRYHSAPEGKTFHVAQNWVALVAGIAQGDPHDITTLGLVVLTLVPVCRVAFTFILFVKEHDRSLWELRLMFSWAGSSLFCWAESANNGSGWR
jgi:uncharacterized membrane protein